MVDEDRFRELEERIERLEDYIGENKLEGQYRVEESD